MAVPHYTYLVLKMPSPKGIFIVKGSFELSDLCDKEFHKMAQNFSMMANYGEPKDKAKSSTTGATQQLEGHPTEPEVKKRGYSHQNKKNLQEKKRGPRRYRRQSTSKIRVEKIRL
jgi:hypothetical protein